jgi:hypothetical protein
MVAVKSNIDPTMPGQEEIIQAPEVPNIKTRLTGGRPEAQRLSRSVEQSEQYMEVHKAQNRRFIRNYAGSNYGVHLDADQPDPLNLLFSLVSTLVPALTVDPKATVETVRGDLAFAETFRLAIDDEAEKINLCDTMKSVIIDSLFGLGIVKTGLKAAPGFSDEGNLEIDQGTIFSERVSFANYIVDMASSTRRGAQYEGDRYEITEDYARSTGMFDEQTIGLLINATNTAYAVQTSRTTGGHERSNDDEFIQRLQLVDLYLPTEGKIVTIPGDVRFSSLGFLNEFKWDGDPSGPYDTLGFSPVPDKILPTPVIGAIYDMYVLTNKLARKIARQADRQKDIVVYQKGMEDDGDAVRDSSDGDMVGVADIDHVKPLSFGGANDDGFKAVAWYQDFFNKIAGNPDLIGGLSADANTLGQDQLSLQNANGRIDDWRQTALKVASSILRKLGGYVWSDRDTKRSLQLVDGDLKFPREFGKKRKGEFEDYKIGIDAHHRPPMSPDQEVVRIERYLNIVSNPQMVEAARAQGLAIDVRKAAKILGSKLGIDNDTDEMFVPVEDIEGLQRQGQQLQQAPQPQLSQPSPVLTGETG